MNYYCLYHSPLGDIIIESDGEFLTGVCFDCQNIVDLEVLQKNSNKELSIFTQTKKWLDIYFSGKEPDFIPPLSFPEVSLFRKRVWEILLEIPYGKTITYGEIAKQIEKESGKRVSAQAVGGAVGHNKIAIIVPCHRVMGKNRRYTGYAGGILNKKGLLKFEGVNLNKFHE